jgi:OOP family OmpA-OmpF porin
VSLKTVLVTAFLILTFRLAGAQDSTTVMQLDELVISLRLNRADILFPRKFDDYYRELERIKAVAVERPLTSTEISDLSRLFSLFSELNSEAEDLRPYLSGVFEARDDALANDAQDFAPELFQRAEKNLYEVADRLSGGNVSDSRQKTDEVIRKYREAEYEAVKNKLLSEVRILMQESKDLDAEKTAPRTYRKVNDLLKEVESIINAQNFNDPSLGEKAATLLEESKHLLYLAQTARQIHRDDTAFENYMLQLEDSVYKLALMLNVNPSFSGNMENAMKNINHSVSELKNELESQKKQNTVLLDSLNRLRKEIIALQTQLGADQTLREKVDNLRARLAPQNIKVMYQSDQIVIRMNGIDFPLGQTRISNDERTRLEKIGEALRAFPNRHITVRLGQSSSGNSQYNKTLAEKRARAAALIIQNAGYIQDSRISSEGVLVNQNGSTAYAVVDVVVDLK